jgi:hypothetical protein
MSKNHHQKETAIAAQLALIDSGLSEGCLDLSLGLKQLHSRQLHGMDRWLVAAQMSKSTGIEISKDMLDKRLSSDPAYQPYTIHSLAISAITQDLRAMQYLLEPLGSDVLDPKDKDLIEYARLQVEKKRIESRMMVIEKNRGLK